MGARSIQETRKEVCLNMGLRSSIFGLSIKKKYRASCVAVGTLRGFVHKTLPFQLKPDDDRLAVRRESAAVSTSSVICDQKFLVLRTYKYKPRWNMKHIYIIFTFVPWILIVSEFIIYQRTVRHTHINKDTTNICSHITIDLIINWCTINGYFNKV